MIEGALSDYIMNHIERWQFNDDKSDKIDQCIVTFNASRIESLPPYGTSYKLSIHGVSRGTWSVIGTSINNNNSMTLKLSTVTKDSLIKQKSSKSYSDKTIAEIVHDVVSMCGYAANVAPELASKVFVCFRSNETAGDFLNRIADINDAVSKPYNKTWVFAPRLSTTTSRGAKPTLRVNKETRIVSASIARSADKAYQGVKVRFWDSTAGKPIERIAGSAPYNDYGNVTEAKANELLTSVTTMNKSASESLSLVLPTSEKIVGMAFAEGVIDIDISRFIKGEYIIDSVSMNERTTNIQASLPKL